MTPCSKLPRLESRVIYPSLLCLQPFDLNWRVWELQAPPLRRLWHLIVALLLTHSLSHSLTLGCHPASSRQRKSASLYARCSKANDSAALFTPRWTWHGRRTKARQGGPIISATVSRQEYPVFSGATALQGCPVFTITLHSSLPKAAGMHRMCSLRYSEDTALIAECSMLGL